MEQMWNKKEVLAVRGTPLQPHPNSDDNRIRTKMIPGLATTEVIGDPVTAQDIKEEVGGGRPFYFMRADVKIVASKIGYTDNCAGCRAVRLGFTSRPPHSLECRARMEPEMKKLPRGNARMEQFEHKLASEVEKRVRLENKIAKTEGALVAQESSPDSIQENSVSIQPQPITTGNTITDNSTIAGSHSSSSTTIPATTSSVPGAVRSTLA